MTIRAVFRVQCDGPCGGWLSETGDVIRLNPPSRDAGMYPGERSARLAAEAAGWDVIRTAPVTLRCPSCTANPLDILLPKLPDPDDECVCRHPFHAHNFRGLCVEVPGVTGCGCLGFLKREGSGW